MLAPHDDVTAPLAQWTTIKEPGDPGEPVYNVNFPSEKSCNDYRACLYGGCFRPGTVIGLPKGILGWWSEMRVRQLIKALGYRLQEKAIGGLKPSTRRLLERWGRNGSGRGPLAEPARTRLKAGTVLVREWHGVTHRVTMLDDGFDFDGERFRSLSEIARKITGVRWSGPLFFV